MSKIMGLCIAVLVVLLLGATGYISYDIGHSDGYSSGYYSGKQVCINECAIKLEQQGMEYETYVNRIKAECESDLAQLEADCIYELGRAELKSDRMEQQLTYSSEQIAYLERQMEGLYYQMQQGEEADWTDLLGIFSLLL